MVREEFGRTQFWRGVALFRKVDTNRRLSVAISAAGIEQLYRSDL